MIQSGFDFVCQGKNILLLIIRTNYLGGVPLLEKLFFFQTDIMKMKREIILSLTRELAGTPQAPILKRYSSLPQTIFITSTLSIPKTATLYSTHLSLRIYLYRYKYIFTFISMCICWSGVFQISQTEP